MRSFQKMGMIVCGNQDRLGTFMENNYFRSFPFKKVLLMDGAAAGVIKTQYPEVEIVNDMNEILHDNDINHLIVASAAENDKQMIGELLRSGKTVQVI